MLQQVIRVGSFILVVSASLYAMEKQSLKQITTKKVAQLIASNPNSSYGVTAFNALPHELGASIMQYLILTNRSKSILPIVLLSYKLQQSDYKHSRIHLTCSNSKRVKLTLEQSRELTQSSVTIQNLIQDLDIQDTAVHAEEIPLPLLTQEQITNLLPYISITHALSTSNNTLPIVQQEIPETAALSSYYLKYTALQQLKKHLTAQKIPTLCDLIITASYLDIQSTLQATYFVELVTHALGHKLLRSPQYQDEYSIINTLPNTIQRNLVHYLIDNSAVRYALCSNNTHTITSTVQTLTGHTHYVSSVSWSPDGKRIASGSRDKTIKVWDAQSGTCIRTLTGHTAWVYSVSWSPDGKYIASGAHDNTIRVWDASTGICIHTLDGFTDWVCSIVWSPDSKYIASGSFDSTIKVWDAITGTSIHTLKGHDDLINSVSWSPNSKYIASSSEDNTIKIWDAITGTCIHTLQGYTNTNSIDTISWSPDGSQLASSSLDPIIRVWDASTDTCMHTLTTNTAWGSISWSSNGKYIASGSSDNTVKISNITTGTCIHTLTGHDDLVSSVSWSFDSSMIASSSWDETIKLWNIIDKKLDNYLNNTLSWQQALLLVRLINAHNNQHNIDFVHDTKALQCYNSLDQHVKQLVEPLLSQDMHSALYVALYEEVLPRKTKKLRKE